MFIDYARVIVKSGDGGSGAATFRREKYVPAGGPDGGDGGKGGDVYLVVDPDANTLIDFKFKKEFVAEPGGKGSGTNMYGRGGEDLYIKVPLGTIVKDVETDKIIFDLSEEGQKELLFPGGRGGKGNAHFRTSTRQAPRFAQSGEKGIERELVFELKLLADVGLIGFPNVGKSTLLTKVTAAKPKIADYHFTTIEPNLGVVKTEYGESFVVADIPGLIEGASEGIGLGHQFLRHVERTRILLHVLDVSGSEGRDPIEDFDTINMELEKHSKILSTRKQIIVANKIDIMQDDTNYKKLEKLAKSKDLKIFKISGVTGEGVNKLFNYVATLLKEIPIEKTELTSSKVIYTIDDKKDAFKVRKEDGVYLVDGPAIERLIGRVNLGDNESAHYFQKMLKELGVEEKLKEAGIQEGDVVILEDWEFEWYE